MGVTVFACYDKDGNFVAQAPSAEILAKKIGRSKYTIWKGLERGSALYARWEEKDDEDNA